MPTEGTLVFRAKRVLQKFIMTVGYLLLSYFLPIFLEEPSPAYVKIVLTSNMAYGHVNKSSG